LHLPSPQPAGGETKLTKFDLDFPGGTPQQFVAAIEKAMGRPINTIIAEDQESVRISPLKMMDVDLPQLFASLREASYRYRIDNNNMRQVISSLAFETLDSPPSDSAIWRFSSYNAAQAPSALTRFNLNFPGGTPLMLAKAIEKATGKPLNVVIPPEHAEVKLPPLEMKNVDVQQLFDALQAASMKREAYVTGTTYSGMLAAPGQSYQVANTAYGFRTQGRVTDESIWYFFAEKPVGPPLSPPKASRFYSLAPYIDYGLSVDDITTAIQTGWKMLGDKDTPNISFHKDTKLLIAVGEPAKLETIDSVLRALTPERRFGSSPSALQKSSATAPPTTNPAASVTTPKPAQPQN
jgi:hypothetical protein